MRKLLMLTGVAGALFAAAPASAAFTEVKAWNVCTETSLSVCVNFSLMQDGENYQLVVDYVSSEGDPQGVLTSAGLYSLLNSDAITISNAVIVSSTHGVWTVGTSGLSGGGAIELEVGADAQGNDGIPVGGQVVVGFTSTNIGGQLANLNARAHVQSFGENSCSLKPDSNLPGFVVDGVQVVDARCGTETVPEPITMVLLGSGLLGVGGVGYRRKKNLIEKA